MFVRVALQAVRFESAKSCGGKLCLGPRRLVAFVTAYGLMLSPQFVFGIPAVEISQLPSGPAVGCMAFQTIRFKTFWMRVFVAILTCAEFDSYIAGPGGGVPFLLGMTFIAIDFRVLSGQRVIRQAVIEGLEIQANDIPFEALVVRVTFLAASLKPAVVAGLRCQPFLYNLVAIQAKRIVDALCQRVAGITVLELFLLRV